MDKKGLNINWFVLCGLAWCLVYTIIELCQSNLPGAIFHLICASNIMILDYIRRVRSDVQDIKKDLLEKINNLENINKDFANSSKEEIQKLKF